MRETLAQTITPGRKPGGDFHHLGDTFFFNQLSEQVIDDLMALQQKRINIGTGDQAQKRIDRRQCQRRETPGRRDKLLLRQTM